MFASPCGVTCFVNGKGRRSPQGKAMRHRRKHAKEREDRRARAEAQLAEAQFAETQLAEGQWPWRGAEGAAAVVPGAERHVPKQPPIAAGAAVAVPAGAAPERPPGRASGGAWRSQREGGAWLGEQREGWWDRWPWGRGSGSAGWEQRDAWWDWAAPRSAQRDDHGQGSDSWCQWPPATTYTLAWASPSHSGSGRVRDVGTQCVTTWHCVPTWFSELGDGAAWG